MSSYWNPIHFRPCYIPAYLCAVYCKVWHGNGICMPRQLPRLGRWLNISYVIPGNKKHHKEFKELGSVYAVGVAVKLQTTNLGPKQTGLGLICYRVCMKKDQKKKKKRATLPRGEVQEFALVIGLHGNKYP